MWLNRFVKNYKYNCRFISLHGFGIISESRSKLEVLFWLIVLALGLFLCGQLMITHWLRYQSRLIVTNIKSTTSSVTQIPFPAITVCSSNVAHKKYVAGYKTLLLNENIPEISVDTFFANMVDLIYPNDEVTPGSIEQYANIENTLLKHNITMGRLMMKIMHPCEDLLINCRLADASYNCSRLFRVIKTGLGYCCSFNYFRNNDYTIRQNMLSEDFKNPWIAEGAGLTHGLSFEINLETAQYLSPIIPIPSCFIMIHPIWDMPTLESFLTIVQPGDLALLQLFPTIHTADEKLRFLDSSVRTCWFDDEGPMKPRNYSFINCVTKCKEKAIIELCRCIPFFYSRGPRQCTFQDQECLRKYEFAYNNINLSDKPVENSTSCECLPKCEEYIYEGRVNSVKPNTTKEDDNVFFYVYFDHSWCVEYNKNLSLTWDILLASFGGITGLCLGGSLISIIEFFYVFVECVYITIAQRKKIAPPFSVTTKCNKIIFVKPLNK